MTRPLFTIGVMGRSVSLPEGGFFAKQNGRAEREGAYIFEMMPHSVERMNSMM